VNARAGSGRGRGSGSPAGGIASAIDRPDCGAFRFRRLRVSEDLPPYGTLSSDREVSIQGSRGNFIRSRPRRVATTWLAGQSWQRSATFAPVRRTISLGSTLSRCLWSPAAQTTRSWSSSRRSTSCATPWDRAEGRQGADLALSEALGDLLLDRQRGAVFRIHCLLGLSQIEPFGGGDDGQRVGICRVQHHVLGGVPRLDSSGAGLRRGREAPTRRAAGAPSGSSPSRKLRPLLPREAVAQTPCCPAGLDHPGMPQNFLSSDRNQPMLLSLGADHGPCHARGAPGYLRGIYGCCRGGIGSRRGLKVSPPGFSR
jgi:hypothetical protein